jgi:hypothetical protein
MIAECFRTRVKRHQCQHHIPTLFAFIDHFGREARSLDAELCSLSTLPVGEAASQGSSVEILWVGRTMPLFPYLLITKSERSNWSKRSKIEDGAEYSSPASSCGFLSLDSDKTGRAGVIILRSEGRPVYRMGRVCRPCQTAGVHRMDWQGFRVITSNSCDLRHVWL